MESGQVSVTEKPRGPATEWQEFSPPFSNEQIEFIRKLIRDDAPGVVLPLIAILGVSSGD